MEYLLGYLFIFLAKVADVSMATIRMIMVVRGRRLQAAMIGFVEVSIYVLAIGKVLDGLDNPINVIMYASGFATGNYLGIFLEEKMALGNIIVQAVIERDIQGIVDRLRLEGFGVTVFEGYGRQGIRHLINVTLLRKNLPKLYKIIDNHEKNAFVTVTDARSIRGGYFSTIKKK